MTVCRTSHPIFHTRFGKILTHLNPSPTGADHIGSTFLRGSRKRTSTFIELPALRQWENMAIDGTKRSVPPVNMYISWFCHLEVTWQVWGRDRPIKLAELHYMSSSAAAMRTWTARDQTCNLITCPNLRLLWNASMRKPRIWVCRTHTK